MSEFRPPIRVLGVRLSPGTGDDGSIRPAPRTPSREPAAAAPTGDGLRVTSVETFAGAGESFTVPHARLIFKPRG